MKLTFETQQMAIVKIKRKKIYKVSLFQKQQKEMWTWLWNINNESSFVRKPFVIQFFQCDSKKVKPAEIDSCPIAHFPMKQ